MKRISFLIALCLMLANPALSSVMVVNVTDTPENVVTVTDTSAATVVSVASDDDQTASEVPIVDDADIITGINVETALQENRVAINVNTAKVTYPGYVFGTGSGDMMEGDTTEKVVSVSVLRSGSYTATSLTLLGYYGADTPGGGPLYLDASDTTTADNGVTVFVDSDGDRWKRPDITELSIADAGAQTGDDITAELVALMGLSEIIFINPGTYTTTTIDATITGDLTIYGAGDTSIIKHDDGYDAYDLIELTVEDGGRLIIQDLMFDGNSSELTTFAYAAHLAIYPEDDSKVTIQRCHFTDGRAINLLVFGSIDYATTGVERFPIVNILNNTFSEGLISNATYGTKMGQFKGALNLNITDNYCYYSGAAGTWGTRAGFLTQFYENTNEYARYTATGNTFYNIGRKVVDTLGNIDVYAGGYQITITDNIITDAQGRGISTKSDSGDIIISNNQLNGFPDNCQPIIHYGQGTSDVEVFRMQNLIISGNIVTDSPLNSGIKVRGDTENNEVAGDYFKNIIISGNILNDTEGIELYTIQNGIISGNILDEINGPAISLWDCGGLFKVSDNQMYEAEDEFILSFGTAFDNLSLDIHDNSFAMTDANTSDIIQSNTGVVSSLFASNNSFTAAAANTVTHDFLNLNTTGATCRLIGNYFDIVDLDPGTITGNFTDLYCSDNNISFSDAERSLEIQADNSIDTYLPVHIVTTDSVTVLTTIKGPMTPGRLLTLMVGPVGITITNADNIEGDSLPLSLSANDIIQLVADNYGGTWQVGSAWGTSITESDPRLPAHSTAGNLARSTGSAWESWTPDFLTSEVDGSTTNEIEVVDEEFNATNFDGGTASAVSQDDFYDRFHLFDTDDDGDLTDESWWTTIINTFITSTGVTFENLNANGDVGTTTGTVAAGDDSRFGATSVTQDVLTSSQTLNASDLINARYYVDGGDYMFGTAQTAYALNGGKAMFNFGTTAWSIDCQATDNFVAYYDGSVHVMSDGYGLGDYTPDEYNYLVAWPEYNGSDYYWRIEVGRGDSIEDVGP